MVIKIQARGKIEAVWPAGYQKIKSNEALFSLILLAMLMIRTGDKKALQQQPVRSTVRCFIFQRYHPGG